MSDPIGGDTQILELVMSFISGSIALELVKRLLNGISGRTQRQRDASIQEIKDHDTELTSQMEFRENVAMLKAIGKVNGVDLPADPDCPPLNARYERDGVQKALNMKDERRTRLKWQRHAHLLRITLIAAGVAVSDLPETPKPPNHEGPGGSGDAD